ncbi:hypothetical protein HDV05_001384 [Chytridiales sp. JEL 0842]|nr:hypothetical protein HDV05_001384 [Chytridiales sp. JEL 0842]
MDQNAQDTSDITGFVYCPPGWDEHRLRSGPDAEVIGKIAMETYTDLSYIKDKNAIKILGETNEDVYKAQTQLNSLLSPPPSKSKRQWARPDRPGGWGQRRDLSSPSMSNLSGAAAAGAGNGNGLRRMKSEAVLGFREKQQQQQQQQQQQWGGYSGQYVQQQHHQGYHQHQQYQQHQHHHQSFYQTQQQQPQAQVVGGYSSRHQWH